VIRVELPKITLHLLFSVSNVLWVFRAGAVLFLFIFFYIYTFFSDCVITWDDVTIKRQLTQPNSILAL
jgi:hypothetical protein